MSTHPVASSSLNDNTTSNARPPTVAPSASGAGGHRWEETNVGSSWETAVQEDEDGHIVIQGAHRDSLTVLLRQRRRRLEQTDYALRHRRLRRDMIRYVYVVIDASRWMREKDPVLPPGNRLEATIRMLHDFVRTFFDENPLSHLGLVLVRNGEAEILSKLSSSSKPHKVALQSIGPLIATEGNSNNSANGGEFSLQNGIEVAGRSLGHQPRHGSREIVVITAALSTCDPGFLLTETLPRLVQAHIRVSAFALSAELHVCRKLCTATGGSMGVCLDPAHFREWLLNQTVPPPTAVSVLQHDNESSCEMIRMGFPKRTVTPLPSVIHATREKTLLGRTSYACPQCHAKNAELPTDCAVCGLKLVLSPHLARSFHHLFPVPQFAEVATIQDESDSKNNHGAPQSTSSFSSSSNTAAVQQPHPSKLTSDLLIHSAQDDTCCFACARSLLQASSNSNSNNNNSSSTNTEWIRFACPECDNVFCFDCDAFLHESLHNCPGCLAK